MSNKLLFTFLLTVFGCISSYAQDISVHGRVTDEKGGSVRGATVTPLRDKKCNSNHQSDNGEFAINARKGATLVITFVGYASKDYVVDGFHVEYFTDYGNPKSWTKLLLRLLVLKREKIN